MMSSQRASMRWNSWTLAVVRNRHLKSNGLSEKVHRRPWLMWPFIVRLSLITFSAWLHLEWSHCSAESRFEMVTFAQRWHSGACSLPARESTNLQCPFQSDPVIGAKSVSIDRIHGPQSRQTALQIDSGEKHYKIMQNLPKQKCTDTNTVDIEHWHVSWL